MTKGGLKDGEWVEINKLPGDRLAAKWRYLLCKHLRQARPHDHRLRRATEQGYRDHRGYQVHTAAMQWVPVLPSERQTHSSLSRCPSIGDNTTPRV